MLATSGNARQARKAKARSGRERESRLLGESGSQRQISADHKTAMDLAVYLQQIAMNETVPGTVSLFLPGFVKSNFLDFKTQSDRVV